MSITAARAVIAVAVLAVQAADPWTDRLEALEPAHPMAYFELAEEIADAASTRPQRDLARRLYGLAGALDPQRLGRSACLALADLETGEHAKRRLLALAAMLDSAGFGAALTQAVEPDRAAALAVAEACGHYRLGEGTKAGAALRTPGAMELLETYGDFFRGGARRFVEDCKLYRGSRRPMLDDQELTRMLRFEAALLAGANRSWSGELLLTSGRPLIEVDPDRLDETLEADVSRACFRDGQWVACE